MRWVLTSLDMNLVLIPQVSVTLTSQSLIFILDNRGSKWYMVWKPQLTVFQSNNLFPCILSAQLLSLSSICVPSAVLSWILIFYFVENLLMTLCRIVAVCSFLILFLSWQIFNKLRFGFTWLTSFRLSFSSGLLRTQLFGCGFQPNFFLSRLWNLLQLCFGHSYNKSVSG
jgi:hypothetical protein